MVLSGRLRQLLFAIDSHIDDEVEDVGDNEGDAGICFCNPQELDDVHALPIYGSKSEGTRVGSVRALEEVALKYEEPHQHESSTDILVIHQESDKRVSQYVV